MPYLTAEHEKITEFPSSILRHQDIFFSFSLPFYLIWRSQPINFFSQRSQRSPR